MMILGTVAWMVTAYLGVPEIQETPSQAVIIVAVSSAAAIIAAIFTGVIGIGGMIQRAKESKRKEAEDERNAAAAIAKQASDDSASKAAAAVTYAELEQLSREHVRQSLEELLAEIVDLKAERTVMRSEKAELENANAELIGRLDALERNERETRAMLAELLRAQFKWDKEGREGPLPTPSQKTMKRLEIELPEQH